MAKIPKMIIHINKTVPVSFRPGELMCSSQECAVHWNYSHIKYIARAQRGGNAVLPQSGAACVREL